MQAQSRSKAASSLCERFDLAFIIEGWISFHKGSARSSQIRRKAPGRTHTHTVARRALRQAGSSLLPTPSLLHMWAEARRALAQQQKQRPRVKRKSALIFPRATFFPSGIRNFRPYQSSMLWFPFISGLSFLYGLRWPSRNILSVSTSL